MFRLLNFLIFVDPLCIACWWYIMSYVKVRGQGLIAKKKLASEVFFHSTVNYIISCCSTNILYNSDHLGQQEKGEIATTTKKQRRCPIWRGVGQNTQQWTIPFWVLNSVFKQQLFIQIKLKTNFDLKNWVNETAVDKIGVDKTEVDKTGVDEPGGYQTQLLVQNTAVLKCAWHYMTFWK